MANTKIEMRRTARHFAFGESYGYLFSDILPTHVCNSAAATCRFELRGPHYTQSQRGIGIVTLIQTHGEQPNITGTIRNHGNWIRLSSRETANQILACFGLSVDDVFGMRGEPGEGELIEIDLIDIVEKHAAEAAA